MPVDVKICGLTDGHHAHIAAKAGARWLGFVFFDKSPRNLTLDTAAKLKPTLPTTAERVGVFVNAPTAFIEQAAGTLGLDALQLHGDESPEECRRIKRRLGLPVIKAISIAARDDLGRIEPYCESVDAFLFDAKPPVGASLPGGNAVSFPWHLMQDTDIPLPWLLAGGLSADTVGEAVRTSGAAAVDVSSGVETSPGQKDAAKIEGFLKAAKAIKQAP